MLLQPAQGFVRGRETPGLPVKGTDKWFDVLVVAGEGIPIYVFL